MTEVAAKQAASASVMSVIATALLAWVAANKFSSNPEQPPAASGSPSLTRAAAGAAGPQASLSPAPYDGSRTLRPLRDAVFGEGVEPGKPSVQAPWTELQREGHLSLRCLLATVPDPTTSLGFRFDETIDSIEEAARAYGYVLERWRLPWSEQARHAKPAVATEKKGQPNAPEALSPPPSGAPAPVVGDPGLLVFRRAGSAGGKEVPMTDLLLVFLVNETPTQGIDRLAFTHSLELAEALRDPGGGESRSKSPIRIVAPCYSGSLPSLRDALRDWLRSIDGGDASQYEIEILSGTASAFDREGFLKAICAGGFKKLKKVSFSSMTHRFGDILDAILDFLGRSSNDPDVAILSEIDTGFGESVSTFRSDKPPSSGSVPAPSSISLQYPSQVAEIRRRYESQGLMKNGASDVFRSAAELRARTDSDANARDVFPNQAPDWTALAENRVLTQALRYLEDSRFKVIGIIGTDPRDTIFLARLIRRYCPDARVFTVGSDLLYLDSQSIADLRGMIIGSTYPLYAANHTWTGSDPGRSGRVFPSDDAHGVYNAAVVQIARLTARERVKNGTEDATQTWFEEGQNLFEYSTPAPLRHGAVLDPGLPPIWVSVVGERSLHPVDCRPYEPGRSNADRDYLYRARASHSGPGRLVINRSLAWVVFLAAASLVLLVSYSRRLGRASPRVSPSVTGNHRRAPATDLAVTLARVLILAGYLYVACPAFAQLVPATVLLNLAADSWTQIFPWVLVLMPIVVTLAALLASLAEFRARRSSRSAAEGLGTVLVVLIMGYVQVTYAASPRWLLSLDRSTAITGGVSAYVPAAFLMAGLGAWLYARQRISTINDTFAFAPEYDPASTTVFEPNRAILQQIDMHRARFDRWFLTPGHVFRFLRGETTSWSECQPTLIAVAVLVGVIADTLVFRPISWSDEGVVFDLFFRLAFGLLLALLALNFARLYSAWSDFHAVLDGFAKILGAAFERIPKNVSNWLLDADRCNAEYGNLILRRSSSARKLLTGWDLNTEPPKTAVVWDPPEALRHLSILEQRLGEDRVLHREERGSEVVSFRYFARTLNAHWARTAGDDVSSEQSVPDKEKRELTREEKLIHDLEEMLALEAARWVGGALVRVWVSIGFLALASVAMLFAITSYPFPQQSRVMMVIGIAIVVLVIMILRVALSSSRDEVISKIDGSVPGKVTWNSALFKSMAAYVVPLVGLLTAVSFDMLDLFRSVLGPILRIFP